LLSIIDFYITLLLTLLLLLYYLLTIKKSKKNAGLKRYLSKNYYYG